MCMTCCDLVVKLNNFLKINKKTLLILSILLTVVFLATIFYKKEGISVTKENFLPIDPPG